MANMFIKYNIEKYPTANPSNVLSGGTYGGHMFSIKLATDAWNGALVAVGDWESLDLFAEETASTFTGTIVEKMANGNYLVLVDDPGDAVLVYNPPYAAEEYNNAFKSETSFYIPAGEIARAYALAKYDRFELSADGFEGTPEVGATINGVTGKKPVVA